jgi:hypothetical protein
MDDKYKWTGRQSTYEPEDIDVRFLRALWDGCRFQTSARAFRGVVANVRLVLIGAAITLFAMTLGVVVLCDIDTARQVDAARDRRSPVEVLGEPNKVWAENFKCERGWDCRECLKVRDQLKPGERVFLFGRFSAFFVVVGVDGRVLTSAHCGS